MLVASESSFMKQQRTSRVRRIFRSILCPVDFSEHSAVALRYAATLAKRSAGRLYVVYVNDPTLVSVAAIAFGDRGLAASTRKELRLFVGKALPARALATASLRCIAETGHPARTIAGTATRLGCDLIVTGTHGLGGFSKALMGSTSEHLLRHAPVPVLTVPPYLAEAVGSRAPSRQWPGPVILVPLDLGGQAMQDVEDAAEVALALGTQLLLVHVVSEPQPPPWYRADLSAQSRLRTEKARLQLEALAKALNRGVPITTRVLVGSPADEIAAAAAEQRIGLVMMHLRKGPGLFGSRAGSLAYHVLCHAVTPVLAVPDQPDRPSHSKR
jgi:universal stress protein A